MLPHLHRSDTQHSYLRDVAQSGQRTCLGSRGPAVQIRPSRPVYSPHCTQNGVERPLCAQYGPGKGTAGSASPFCYLNEEFLGSGTRNNFDLTEAFTFLGVHFFSSGDLVRAVL